MKRTLSVLGLLLATAPAFTQVLPSVSDAEANGREMVHIGALNSGFIYMSTDCTEQLAQGAKCTVIGPLALNASFNHPDLISFRIPARAVNSLLCFDITPLIDVSFANATSTPTTFGVFSATAKLTIKSSVLNDPAVVRPNGQPFNGQFEIPTIQFFEQVNLAAGEASGKSYHFTRSCANAGVSKHTLTRNLGLTAAQANSFFNNPITVVLSASANTRHVDFLFYQYHVRLYGDRR